MSASKPSRPVQNSEYVSQRLQTGLAIVEAAQERRMQGLCARLGVATLGGRDELNITIPMRTVNCLQDATNVREVFNVLHEHPASGSSREVKHPNFRLSADGRHAVFAGSIDDSMLSESQAAEEEVPSQPLQTTNFIGTTQFAPNCYNSLRTNEFCAARHIATLVGEHGMSIDSAEFDFHPEGMAFTLNGAFYSDHAETRFRSSLSDRGSVATFETSRLSNEHSLATYRSRIVPFDLTLNFVVGPNGQPLSTVS